MYDRKNREGLPKATMEEKLEVGESRLLTKSDNYMER